MEVVNRDRFSAAHGYETTIMDFSLKQLEKDRFVAEPEILDLQTIQANI